MAQPPELPLPPGELGLPIAGETIPFALDPAGFVLERRRKYGDIFKTHLIGAPTIILTDADANQWIFAGESKYLQNKWNKATARLLGEFSTAMLTGQAHSERRALLMPHFRHSAMRVFGDTIYHTSQAHFDRWADQPKPFALLFAMQELVFEIIVKLLLGDNHHVNIPYLSRLFRAWTAGISAPPVNLPFTTFGKALRAKNALLVAINHIVTERRRLAQQPNDILGSLLGVRDETGQPLPQEAIVHELHNQLFAGHDTTVTVMVNLMKTLAERQDVVNAARQELASPKLSRPIDLETVRDLPYLNAVLNESMRFIAPVSGTFRTMLHEMEYKGFRIPQGWTVRLEIAGTHTNPDIWSHPEAFDPERWLPGREEHKHRPYSFIPFGGGPRLCLGMNFAMAEMRLMLALLLSDYAWTLTPGQDMSYTWVPFPRPKNGLLIAFSKHP